MASVLVCFACAAESGPHQPIDRTNTSSAASAKGDASDGQELTTNSETAGDEGDPTSLSTDQSSDSPGDDLESETDDHLPKFDLPLPDTAIDPSLGCARLDILFVTDISGSMFEEKAELRRIFPELARIIDDHIARSDHLESYRIGVTNSTINRAFDDCTSSTGLDGALFDGNNPFGDVCDLDGKLWIEGPGPEVSERLGCMIDFPVSNPDAQMDCGHELPLEVTERFADELALGGANEGFYDKRDNSLLLLVFITDEDEDAAFTKTSPTQTKAVLDELAGGEDRYGVIVVAGERECVGPFGYAEEAILLKKFEELVPHGVFGDLCHGGIGEALRQGLENTVADCDDLPPPD